jgi:hypothetical protein
MICATRDWLEAILDRHSIDAGERVHWRAAVKGKRPPQELLRRFRGSPCLHDILEELSRPFRHYYERAGLL